MHEAYNITNILQLTVQVECLTAYDESLFLGTRQGHLYMYSVTLKDDKPEVSLMRLNKSFSKKAIQQIEIVPHHDLLICLSDNIIQVHNTKEVSFPVVQQIESSKGASFFALHTQVQTSLTGETVSLVRMCIAIKRKLHLFYLKKNNFTAFENSTVNLKDLPKTIIWCGETICVGYKNEYCLYTLNSKDKPQDLFTTGSRSTEPCLVKITENTFAVGRENQTVVVNDHGSAATSKVLKWSDTPTGLIWDKPYLLGTLPDAIHVQNLEPGGMTQILGNLPKVRLITRAKQGLLIAASISNVWCIYAVDVAAQRKVLLDDKQFQLAIQLTHTSNESEEEKKEIINHIHTLLAYDLFRKKEFFNSMKEFLALKSDPYEVIRLYPDLLPQSSSTERTETYEKLTDVDHEKAIQALIDYLIAIRPNTQANVQANVNASGNLNEKPVTTKSTQQLLQIIDTTLLKCYLQTNDALIAPLLRLNYCHLAETEKTLKKHGKHNELIILYQTKGQHRKALELLQSDGTIDRTINYLQKLGPELMGLIFEFADWVLKKSPEEGLKIFIEEATEVEKLPRPRVLDHLMRSHTSLVIPYAEHVVHNWNDTNPLFHNTLVHFYKEKAISNDTSSIHARKKLHDFLQTSPYYTAETVLASFPTDELLDERAILLGKLGRHEQALLIYIRILGNIEKAKEYCEQVYNPDNPSNKDVYLHLLQILLNPQQKTSLPIPNANLSPLTAEPNMDLALDYLERYASKIDPFKALQFLPKNVPMSRINKFVQVALHRKTKERRWVQLLKGLLYSENLQCQEIRLQLLNRSFLINDLNLCSVCKKRFGNQSALVHYPNGNIVHYSCQDKNI
ncbi:vam6/Vps39-like protein [Onthophagus taurus]|uniref:vam6/Vps39-like protein n=1 Tax=Onthophagus taurus TaxID=166361 RepID=UPI000C20FA45|nr:vam6/Vps39-like protein [Onthophagus taurus]